MSKYPRLRPEELTRLEEMVARQRTIGPLLIWCAIRRSGTQKWPDTDTADLDEGRCRQKAEWPPANTKWARENPIVRFGRFREVR